MLTFALKFQQICSVNMHLHALVYRIAMYYIFLTDCQCSLKELISFWLITGAAGETD